MQSTSSITLNLASVSRNIAALREHLAPECGLCVVVKADAYGIGAGAIVQQLARGGVSMLAVYSAAQAEAIAAVDDSLPLLVLMPVREIEAGGVLHRLLLKGRLHLAVHGVSHAHDLAKLAETLGGAALPVHVEVDTGMSRGGSLSEEAARTIAMIADDRKLRIAGVFTHFSDSALDVVQTHAQMDAFEALLAGCAGSIPADALIHAANSHALPRGARFHKAMVRVGLAWTGLADLAGDSEPGPQLESVVTWESTIVHTKEIPAGSGVGYGSRWRASRPTRVGIVPVGYFDGYPMGCVESGGRFVRIIVDAPMGERSFDAPVLGAVNMDQIIVDLTDCSGSLAYTDGFIGMRVEVYGADRRRPNYLPTLARAAGTHPYELLCRLHPMIPRIVVTESATATTSMPAEFTHGVAGAIAS